LTRRAPVTGHEVAAGGWGLIIAGTPYSANALLVQRLTGYDNWHIRIGWSAKLLVVALTLASALAATLTLLLMPG
jgi:Na+(H+)/acetate symporter ActP